MPVLFKELNMRQSYLPPLYFILLLSHF